MNTVLYVFTAQFQWSKIDAMANKGCLKIITTEQNIAVNYPINLPKMSLMRKSELRKVLPKN